MNRKRKQALPQLAQHLQSPVARPFKSPLLSGHSRKTVETPEEKNAKITELKKKIADIQAKIAGLENEGYKENELQDHIDKLHEYNEVKDATSIVLGRIAVFQGIQTKDLYQRYGLELTD